MNFLLHYLRYFKNITKSIAFLPSVISMLFIVGGITFLSIEESEYFPQLKSRIDFAIVKSADTARNLLGILIGGVISLMVFSFSMVMVVLSQALSSLSPRVIPGLISDKRHQTVLGFYLGTLLYLFLVMINLKPGDAIVNIQLNVLLAIVSGIMCLILFTYFIHTISQGIQVEVILEDIFRKTKHQLSLFDGEGEDDNLEEQNVDDIPSGSVELKTNREGYYNGFNKDGLVTLCQKHNCRLYVIIRPGTYVYQNMTIGYISGGEYAEMQSDFFSHFFLERSIADDHYLYGLKYISEIGVKALSPGINDPGTALKAINFLTVLIIQRMALPDRNRFTDAEDNIRIVYKPLDVPTLIYHFYTPFRTYGGNDITVMLTLFRAFNALIQADLTKKKYVSDFYDGMLSIRSTIAGDIQSEMDKVIFNVEIENVNKLDYFLKPLPLLTLD